MGSQKIKWHVKQQGDIQVEMLQLPLTIYDNMGKLWVSFSGTGTVFMVGTPVFIQLVSRRFFSGSQGAKC